MATYDAHVADVGNTITRTLRIGGAALGTLTGATFVVKATNPSGVVESWTNGFTGGTSGLLTFVTPTDAYWDEVGTWTWDVQYTLGGVTATCDPITLSVGPSGAPPGTSGPPDATWINVRGYGAVADGTTDDGPAIQAALDAAAAQTYGATVYIPPGVYYIGNTLLVGSNTHVLGAGRGLTVLRGKAGGYAGKTVNGHGVTATISMCAVHHSMIENLTVDHQTLHTQANGITMEVDGASMTGTRPSYCTVQNCEVLGYDIWEYLIWNLKGEHIRILDNDINGYGATFPGNTEGIESLGGTDILIRGNKVRNCAAAGIVVAAMTDVAASGVIGAVVHGNIIDGCNTGIGCGPAWDSGTGTPQNISQLLFYDNVILNSVDTGIGLVSGVAGVTIHDVVFEGNLVSGAVRGIYSLTQDTDAHKGIVFRGNTVRDCTSTTGMVQLVGMAEVRFEGNRIENAPGHAFYMVNCDDAIVRGNIIDTAEWQAMVISQCNDAEIVDNTMREFNSDGIYSAVTLGTCTRCLVRGNTLSSSFSGGWFTVAADCDEVRVYQNENFDDDPIWSNAGTNQNRGQFTFALNDTFTDITNTLANDTSRFLVTQVSGTLRMHCVVRTVTGFRITINAAAAGDEVFRWEILQ